MIETKPNPNQLVEDVDAYIFLLQDLLWKILKDAEEMPALKKRFGKLFKKGYPESLQLPKAYLTLIAHLLKFDPLPLEPHQFPNGTAVMDTLGCYEAKEIAEPIELAQLGILWMILGVRQKNDVLQRAGLKVALWQIHLLDGQGRPHLSTWCRASVFRFSTLLLWNYVLFTIAYRMTGEKMFAQLAEKAKEQAWDPDAFQLQLLHLVPSTMIPSIVSPFQPFSEEITVGIIKFATAEMSFIAQVSGWNSGLFSFHKRHVAILNSGPQMGAFDDLSKFGIQRTWGEKNSAFQDVTWEKTAYHCHLKGWTRLAAAPLWLSFDSKVQAGQATIDLKLQEKPLSEEVSFLLFLKAEKLVVGGKHLLAPAALDGYEGKPLPIELQGDGEKMVVQTDGITSMKVIPLAGGDHFWGAEFLVALTLETSSQASFHLCIK